MKISFKDFIDVALASEDTFWRYMTIMTMMTIHADQVIKYYLVIKQFLMIKNLPCQKHDKMDLIIKVI